MAEERGAEEGDFLLFPFSLADLNLVWICLTSYFYFLSSTVLGMMIANLAMRL